MTNEKGKNIKPTVIIIGAGASADFCPKNDKDQNRIKMPVGEELVKKIEGFGSEIKHLCGELFRQHLMKICNELSSNCNESEKKNVVDAMSSLIVSCVPDQKFDFYFGNQYQDKTFKTKPPTIMRVTGQANGYAINTNVYGFDRLLPTQFKLLYDLLTEMKERNTDTGLSSPHIPNGVTFSLSLKDKYRELKPDINLQKYIDLGKLIKYYDPVSIDFFLQSIEKELINIEIDDVKTKKDDLASAGKELIAYYLLMDEVAGSFNADNKIWYRWLRNAIITIGNDVSSIEEGLKNLTIVSFNYDRSLEQYLEEKLPEYHQNIKIIYLYGSLYGEHSKDIQYGKIKDTNIYELFKEGGILKNIASNIFVIGEERKGATGEIVDTPEAKGKEAAEKLMNAKKIYLLGFGFLEENCELIGFCEKWVAAKWNKPNNGSGNISVDACYTNFGDSKKIEKRFDKIFCDGNKENRHSSIKGVYDALEKDFDLSF